MWWMSIEVLHGELSAERWRDAYGSFLDEAAITNGAREWSWHRDAWGVVFQVAFPDEEAWERFRDLPAVHAALDAVPDRINGLLIYRGRGGSSGRVVPRRPRPMGGSGAAALPIPPDDPVPAGRGRGRVSRRLADHPPDEPDEWPDPRYPARTVVASAG